MLQITNTGDRAGAEVVQVYVSDPEASVARPLQELKGFAKVHLEPGETAEVAIELDERAFSFWNPAEQVWACEAGDVRGARRVVLPRSSRHGHRHPANEPGRSEELANGRDREADHAARVTARRRARSDPASSSIR